MSNSETSQKVAQKQLIDFLDFNFESDTSDGTFKPKTINIKMPIEGDHHCNTIKIPQGGLMKSSNLEIDEINVELNNTIAGIIGDDIVLGEGKDNEKISFKFKKVDPPESFSRLVDDFNKSF